MWDSLRVVHSSPLRDWVSSLNFFPPSPKRTRWAALIPYVMTQPRYSMILSTLGLNKAHMVLFLRRPYIRKCVLTIKIWITPYKPSISLVFYQCEIHLGYYKLCILSSFLTFWLPLKNMCKLKFKYKITTIQFNFKVISYSKITKIKFHP